MDDDLSQEIGHLDLTFEALQVLKKIPSRILVEEGIIPHADKHF